jgi:hypothetical protein
MTKFHGTLEELKAAVDSCGVKGEWKANEKANNHAFRGRTGEILNWWRNSTGSAISRRSLRS